MTQEQSQKIVDAIASVLTPGSPGIAAALIVDKDNTFSILTSTKDPVLLVRLLTLGIKDITEGNFGEGTPMNVSNT